MRSKTFITRGLLATCAATAGLALTLPGAASAAGATGGFNTHGDFFYIGDGGDNVVTVNTEIRPQLGSMVVTFSEPGITETNDPQNVCTPSPGRVSCVISSGKSVILNGNAGNDRITIETGPNTPTSIYGNAGSDTIIGGGGPEIIEGGADADEIHGGGWDDVLSGGLGADSVFGDDGDDIAAIDDSGGDRIDLGAGHDLFQVSNVDGTNDVLDGGPGLDTLLFTSTDDFDAPDLGATIDLSNGTATWKEFVPYPPVNDTLSRIEDAGEGGTSGDDVLIGDEHSNVLLGGYGNDRIVGGAGADRLHGDGWLDERGQIVRRGYGIDTIDSFDGFEDAVDCGAFSDSLVADQFDAPLLTECETPDVRTADPYGQAPQPTGPAGGPQPEPRPQPDVKAPSCSPAKLPAAKRTTFLKRGFTVALSCDEPARVEVSASSKAIPLGSRTASVGAGKRTIRFKVPRAARVNLGKKFSVRVRIDAFDAAGNRKTTFASFKVADRKGAR